MIRYRFSDKQREALMKMKWWDKDFEWFEENGKYFSDVEKFIEHFNEEN